MTTPRRLTLTLALGGLAAAARGQVPTADQGLFAASGGVLAVDAQTGLPGRLLMTKAPGYSASYPPDLVGTPDFRTQSIAPSPLGALVIDAFSIGLDWITANGIGECNGPEGRWAALLYSVTPGTHGLAGTPIADEDGNGQDRAAGDIFCYTMKGDPSNPLTAEGITRAIDSTDISIYSGSGTPNVIAYDWFAAQYMYPELRDQLPAAPTAYFSVSDGTKSLLPAAWLGGDPNNRSGATVFKTTWRPGQPGSWSKPTVYLTPANLGLQSTDDVDALAVDETHHSSHYVLFSTVNPTIDPVRFLNRGTGWLDTYRFAGRGPVSGHLGLNGGDIDALCTTDPDADERMHAFFGTDAGAMPTPYPPPWPWPSPNSLSCAVYRAPGTTDLLLTGASDNPQNAHEWWIYYPDLQPPLWLSWSGVYRDWSFKGGPSTLVVPHNPAMLGLRAQIGVREMWGFSPQAGSRFVGITEAAEAEHNLIAPAALASAPGGTSAAVWSNQPVHAQCIYDTSHFTSQGISSPILLDQIEWRLAGNLTGTEISYPQVQVSVGYAATNYLTPSPTFANNIVGGGSTWYATVWNGPVTVLPGWGLSPNRYAIRVPFITPFLYDPTLGLDLLVDVEITSYPNPAQSTSISMANGAATYLANMVLGSQGSGIGTVMGAAPICRFRHQDSPAIARTRSFGKDCYARHASFYELFAGGGFDLGGATTRSLRLAYSPTGYTVNSGSNVWYAPATPNLGLTDDSYTVVTLPAGHSFRVPNNATAYTQLSVCSNGFVSPGVATTTSFLPTAAALLAGLGRFCVCWADLDPGVGGSVHAGYDAATNTYHVTWLAVPVYSTTSPTGHVTMQVAFDLGSNDVEFRWQTCWLQSPSLVGWSPGNAAADPGARDLAELPFVTTVDRAGLRVSASARPLLGTTINYNVTGIPPGAPTLLFVGLAGLDPGADLAFLGMPGCLLFVWPSPVAAYTLLTSPSASQPYTIPASSGLIGFKLYQQALAFVQGINNFGAVTSNGLETSIGNY